MHWEDEVQEQKDERDIRRNLWKSIVLLIGGGATIVGWIYVAKTYILPAIG